MKKSIKTKAIAILMLLFSLFMFAGCGKLNDTLDDVLGEYNVKSQITYYSGEEGWFGKAANGELIHSFDLYYKHGQKPFAVGMSQAISGAANLESNDYEIVDWAMAGGRLFGVDDSLFFFNPYSSTCPTYFPTQVGVIHNRVGDHCFYRPTSLYADT